jgi:hypothetical protein
MDAATPQYIVAAATKALPGKALAAAAINRSEPR